MKKSFEYDLTKYDPNAPTRTEQFLTADGVKTLTTDANNGAVLIQDSVDPDSLNPVTGAAVADAVAGASGEVPVIGDGDNGKVLKAVVDGSSKSVAWGDDSVDLVSNGGLEKNSSGAIGVKVDGTTIDINASGELEANIGMLYNILGVQTNMPETIPSGYIRVKYRGDVPYAALNKDSCAIFYADHPDTCDLNQSIISGKAVGQNSGAYLKSPYQFDILGGVISSLQLKGATGLITATGISFSGTSAKSLFQDCTNLVSVDIDTTGLTTSSAMFAGCTSLKTVPLLNTATMTQVGGTSSTPYGMFQGCTSVESGALALYQQMSTQSTPPSGHSYCFTNCGSGTVAGAAELAQIPASWGGTGEG